MNKLIDSVFVKTCDEHVKGLGRTLDPEMDLLWAAAPFLVKDRLFS